MTRATHWISPGIRVFGYCVWHWFAGAWLYLQGDKAGAAVHQLLADEAAGIAPHPADSDVRKGDHLGPLLAEMMARHRWEQTRKIFDALNKAEVERSTDMTEALDVVGDELNAAFELWSVLKASSDRSKLIVTRDRMKQQIDGGKP